MISAPHIVTFMTPEEWAKRIQNKWGAIAQSVFECGQLLIEAKAQLQHGQWLEMCEGLPFSEDTAQRLMKIAADPRLTNNAHGRHLPGSWRTLYELTKLTDEEFEAGLCEGRICPEMQRKEVVELRKGPSGFEIQEERKPEETCTTNDLYSLISQGRKFSTVYADPPWLYGNQGTRAATSNHYSGMTNREIADLPISELAEENAHLHLWTTNAFLFECKEIMEAWGFTYKSCFVWVKPQMGIGNYWRVSHEFLLFGIRGKAPFMDRGLKSWKEEKRNRHSEKPEAIRSMIERASPPSYLELFARRPVDGWTVWGNEIERTVFNQ